MEKGTNPYAAITMAKKLHLHIHISMETWKQYGTDFFPGDQSAPSRRG